MRQAKLSKLQLIFTGVILLVAIIIRFVNLGMHPLSEPEANLALQALATSKGVPIQWSGEALYLAFTSGLFFLFDQTNFTARLIPAIFGALFVFSPFLFRRSLGNTITILVSAFLALDPAMVALSRTAGGSMVTLFALAATIHFLLNEKIVPSGITAGIALLSGTGFWSSILPLVVISILWIIIKRRNWNFSPTFIDPIIKTVKERFFRVSLVVSIVVIGTLWFIFPRSLSALTGSITDYFQLWKEQGSLSLTLFLSGVIIYFVPALLFGIWGGIRSMIKNDQTGIFLFLWFLAGTIVTLLLPGRDLTQMIWAILPLYLLAAKELSLHFESEQGELIPFAGVALLVFTIFCFLWLSFGKITYGGDQKELLIAVGAGISILVLSGFLIVLGWSARIASKGYLWGVLGVLVIYMFSTAWRVSGINNIEETEMIGPSRSLPQLGLIDKTISELSNWNYRSSTGIQVTLVGLDSRSLEWGLKNFPYATFRDGISSDENPSVVLTMKDAPFNFQNQYRGEDFVYERSIDWQSFQPLDWISWLIHRKVQNVDTSIVLWARANLFTGGTNTPAQ